MVQKNEDERNNNDFREEDEEEETEEERVVGCIIVFTRRQTKCVCVCVCFRAEMTAENIQKPAKDSKDRTFFPEYAWY